MEKKSKLLERIKRAEEALEVADGELEEVLRAVRVAPRAEKTMITQVVGEAFGKMKAAKASLVDLEAILATDDD